MPKLCLSCHQHYIDTRCPHCTPASKSLPLAILLGLGLVGCPSKTDDSGSDTDTAQDTADPMPEPEDAPMYGVESVE